jgi:hypothetical protein
MTGTTHNLPFTISDFRISATGNQIDARNRLRKIKSALDSLSVVDLAPSETGMASGLIAEIRANGRKPIEIEQILEQLVSSPVSDDETVNLILRLHRISVFGPIVEHDESITWKVEIRTFTRLLVEQLLAGYWDVILKSARVLWQEVCTIASQVPPFDTRSRTALCRGPFTRLGHSVRLLDVPDVYDFLAEYLRHPWPEIRDRGAVLLKDWRGPHLTQDLMASLAQGAEDVRAPLFSSHILDRLIELRDHDSVNFLIQLKGTLLDTAKLHLAIEQIISNNTT